jgi:hypothetical protein
MQAFPDSRGSCIQEDRPSYKNAQVGIEYGQLHVDKYGVPVESQKSSTLEHA